MAAPGRVLALYEELARTLAHMVALAHDRQWEHLPALDARCCALAAQLHAVPAEDLAPEALWRVVTLARDIHADQERLSGVLQPQLQRMVGVLRCSPSMGEPG